MLIHEAFTMWRDEIRPHVVAQYGEDDQPALSESWNNYTDSLCKDGDLTALQIQYCPAFDDDIPGDDDAERELILDGLGLTIDAVFIPFSVSRNKDAERKTLNWRVTVKRSGRDILSTDYSAGIGHCPGYLASKAPATFQPHRYRSRSTETPSGWKYRYATEREALAQYRDAIAAAECESGFAMEIDPLGHGAENVFRVKRAPVMVDGRRTTAPVPIMPDRLDVLACLVMDSSVLDSGGFEEWATDCGYDTDSRSAEATYLACLDIALKLRAGVGNDTLEHLLELFTDY
jgi:hypothetical protein